MLQSGPRPGTQSTPDSRLERARGLWRRLVSALPSSGADVKARPRLTTRQPRHRSHCQAFVQWRPDIDSSDAEEELPGHPKDSSSSSVDSETRSSRQAASTTPPEGASGFKGRSSGSDHSLARRTFLRSRHGPTSAQGAPRRSPRSPGRVLVLHRNPYETSPRTCGFGLRAVGGRRGMDGRLGTFVTMVTRGGSADVDGSITEGCQILQWEGVWLDNLSFEAVQQMIKSSPDVISLVVLPSLWTYRSGRQERWWPGGGTGCQKTSAAPDPSQCGRLLPKTPVEIGREARRASGQLLLRLQLEDPGLTVTVLRAQGVTCLDRPAPSPPPNPLAMVRLLPPNGFSGETPVEWQTEDPQWDMAFFCSGLTLSQVRLLSLEVTVWSREGAGDSLAGEVLLDLDSTPLDGQVLCLPLADHDENSCTLQPPHNPLQPSPSLSPSHSPAFPSDQEQREDNLMIPSSLSSRDYHFPCANQDSFTDKVWRKMSSAMLRVSSSLSISKDNEDPGIELSTSRSLGDLAKSFTKANHPIAFMDLMSQPHSLMYTDSVDDSEAIVFKGNGGSLPDRPAPDGDDITSILGPGQVAPTPLAETSQCGDIRLGFMVTKGQLEVDVVCAKSIGTSGRPPDTYVKTYLEEGSSTRQKRKTQCVRGSQAPSFRRTVKYSACNIHGRHLRVDVWQRSRGFEKKQCLGEVVVRLDALDLGQHSLAWYKLFPPNSTDTSSQVDPHGRWS